MPVINICDDVILSSNEYEDNALFYQLKQELAEEIKIFSADSFEKIYFYIDFIPKNSLAALKFITTHSRDLRASRVSGNSFISLSAS